MVNNKIKLISELGVEIEVKALPKKLQSEYFELIQSENVLGKVTIRRFNDSFIFALCVRRDIPRRTIREDIQVEEKIVLVFREAVDAPSIYSDRIDFPQDLPHLNPVNENSPMSICVSRLGANVMYKDIGIRGVVKVLSQWLTDAASGFLDYDGWEPTPFVSDNVLVTNIGELQRFFYEKMERSGICFGRISGFSFVFNGRRVYSFKLNNIELTKLPSISFKQKDKDDAEFYLDTIWSGIYIDKVNEVDARYLRNINSSKSLKEFCNVHGVGQKFEQLKRIVLDKSREIKSPLKMILVVAIPRTIELIKEIPTDATGEARKVELFSFVIHVHYSQDSGMTDIKEVEQLSITPNPTAELSKMISGIEESGDGTISIVGCGSVGSHLADTLAREGRSNLLLIDNDKFETHNISRHVLQKSDIGWGKSNQLKEHLLNNGYGNITSSTNELRNIDDEIKSQLVNSDLVIDATADKDTIYSLDSLPVNKVARCYISNKGKTGVLLFTKDKAECNLEDLEVYLLMKSLEEDFVKDWLNSEANPTATMVGMSCSSITTRLSVSYIRNHVSNFNAVVNCILKNNKINNSIWVNSLNKDGLSLGCTQFQVSDFKKIKNEGWEISICDDVIQSIRGKLHANSPVECGGFLYGRLNLKEQRIVIVKETEVNPTKATEFELELPSAESSEEHKNIEERSAGMLQLVGSWHTHPSGTSKFSGKDIKMKETIERQISTPFALMTVSNNDETVQLAIPNEWRELLADG
ncbi:ThiF family adenylyltransferase [Kangiella geojedonensis]|uniref:UBA/THIF-type NAD/FAD binding protein n=1 Tax=Kangiella geojedonensis TaxID=914150 RepID=A0A0F6TS78_9GAMM|nr:ThiF family adenylyltransferase [Kangiella geojedonensis]AKE52709.1 hypothetical protein TQ33_1768 [Kangiella geojedonensis]